MGPVVFSVVVTSGGSTAVEQFALPIAAAGACTITSGPSLGTNTVGTFANDTLIKTGNCPPAFNYIWAAKPWVGTLPTSDIAGMPPGLFFGADQDVINGTPTTAGTYGFNLQIIDTETGAVNPAAQENVTITIVPAASGARARAPSTSGSAP
jgi:hypothetical protein